MLYKGDMKKYSTAIAKNEGEEAELIKSGWLDYTELPDREMGVAGGSIGAGALSDSSGFNKDAFVPVEQFDALGEENIKLKEELVEALKENQELRKQIRLKELEDKPADELKAILDKAEVKYKANTGKPELAQLVLDHESKGDSAE